ncbi:hypothetical protein TNCV_1576781 [Trichonephila clavipes]|nr:hypothetical protein TNCV_1576781 [Trichonephila clavipes]
MGLEVHEQMFRSGGQSDTKRPRLSGWSLSLPQSSLIGTCNRSAPGSHHVNLPPLELGDKRLTCLIPTPKRHLIHHLVAINCFVTFTLKVCLCPEQVDITLHSSCLWPLCAKGTQIMDVVPSSFLPI